MVFTYHSQFAEWLDISVRVQSEAWQRSQISSETGGQWTAYLNQLCLQTVLEWLQEHHDAQAKAFLDGDHFPVLWNVLTGSAIAFGAKRLVLIPTEAMDTSEVRVPQEWVDIPAWAGDYYLAIEVEPEDQWIKIWGYTTHEQLKQKGTFDPTDRTYCLAGEFLIPDLNVLWVMHQLNPQEQTQAAIAPLQSLSSVEAERLIRQLSNPAVDFPRLELPFGQWAALITQHDWLQRLYEARTRVAQATFQPRASVPGLTHLSRWLQDLYETGWGSLESVLGPKPNLAYTFRRDGGERAEVLVRRAKIVRPSPGYPPVALIVIVGTEQDGRREIQIQMCPVGDAAYLPPHLNLILLSSEGRPLQAVQTRSQDNMIQLKRFKCAPETAFQVQVAIADAALTESFVS